jgi:hypothetical protein
MQSWPHVRAVPQRALLLLRILPCAGTQGATMSANKSVSHLADASARPTIALDDMCG